MTAPGTRTPHEGDAARHWVASVLEAVDARDANRFCQFLADDAVFVFGNAAPLRGIAVIRQTVDAFFQAVHAVHHDVTDVWARGATIICRGTVYYTRHDGSTLTVPFANVVDLRGERAARYQIFVDASAL